ncbi:MAG: hypothetical protein WCC65_17340 [Pseudonocardiaceae bacterium]
MCDEGAKPGGGWRVEDRAGELLPDKAAAIVTYCSKSGLPEYARVS